MTRANEAAALLLSGETIETGSWILDYMPEIETNTADVDPNATIRIDPDGNVFIRSPS